MKRFHVLLAAIAASLLSGCEIASITEGSVTRFAYADSTRLILIAVPSVLVGGTLLLTLFRSTRLGGLIAAGFIGAFAGLIIPGVLMDEVRVEEERMFQRTGFWFSPTLKGFRYDEVDYVRITRKADHQDRLRNIWELHGRDGSVREVDPGDLWDDSSPSLVPLLKARGVRFE